MCWKLWIVKRQNNLTFNTKSCISETETNETSSFSDSCEWTSNRFWIRSWSFIAAISTSQNCQIFFSILCLNSSNSLNDLNNSDNIKLQMISDCRWYQITHNIKSVNNIKLWMISDCKWYQSMNDIKLQMIWTVWKREE